MIDWAITQAVYDEYGRLLLSGWSALLHDVNQISLAHKQVAEKLQTGIVEELKSTYREKEQDRKNVRSISKPLSFSLSNLNWL
jgi:hypothetical protein